jgi:hypothetical protein
MRRLVSFIELTCVLFVGLTAPESGQQHSRDIAGKCGIPVAGIALCLSRSEEPGGGTLEVRNTGPKDAVLNLGIMRANGARQYPTAITLVLTDAEGRQHHVELTEPALVGGRVDPFIVPLPTGASFELPLRLSKYAFYPSGDLKDFRPDPKQRYTVQAQLTGKGVSRAEANLDVKGIALMPYWAGAVASNAVVIGPE